MRILLVRPQQPDETHGLKHVMITEPLELEYIAASVPEHELHIHDMLVDTTNLEAVLKDINPHIVGTTCYINNVTEALEVCEKAKCFNKDIYTVIGGVHATLNPQDFYFNYMDIIVQGEGITVFREIVDCIEKGVSYKKVKGISYRNVNSFISTEKRSFPTKVEDFPFPNRQITKKHRAKYYYFQWSPLTIVRASWGCPFKCNFCYNRHLTDDKYFLRSPESVVEELETIVTKHVFFIDDTFLFNKKWLRRFHDLIVERNISKEFVVYGRTDFIANNEEIMKELAEIGLVGVRVGMEAVTDEELKGYNKKNTVENNNRALEICRRNGIDISASFMIPPHYKKEDFKKVEKYILDNGLLIVFINPLTPLPGIDFYNKYADQLLVPHDKGYPLWDFQHCVIKPTGMSLKQFYFRMGLIYLKTANPFRVRKLEMRRKPELSFLSIKAIKLYSGLIKILFEVFVAHKDHVKVYNKYRSRKSANQEEKSHKTFLFSAVKRALGVDKWLPIFKQ